jgi:hypothetical protein
MELEQINDLLKKEIEIRAVSLEQYEKIFIELNLPKGTIIIRKRGNIDYYCRDYYCNISKKCKTEYIDKETALALKPLTEQRKSLEDNIRTLRELDKLVKAQRHFGGSIVVEKLQRTQLSQPPTPPPAQINQKGEIMPFG